MADATLSGLRARMTAPAAPRPPEMRAAPGGGMRRAEVDRILHLAAGLFEVATAALVLAGPGGLAVAAASGSGDGRAPGAVEAACGLFEVLAAAEPPAAGRPGGVMEEVSPGRGFVAAIPVLSPAGRCLGALVLLDRARHTLMTGLQRRLFAEFGDLVAPALAAAAPDPASRLQDVADADPDAFALFDAEGRCLLRNARFDALVGDAAPGAGAPEGDARGREAEWIALRLARDAAPVGVYRAALADGTWLSVEERRGPHGRSLIARVEERDAFGGDGEMGHLFERCPFPMFVFDRDTRAVLAVNAAALALYGWDRDAFLRLDLGGIGPVGPADARNWTHRTRDGRPLPVSGRAVDLAHRGRPAVLVTVEAAPAAAPVDRAA